MRIIQISDLHIKKNKDAILYNANPRKSLELTLEQLLKEKNDFDILLLTGDISDDGSLESYEFVLNLLEKTNKMIYYINGNHDNKNNLISKFSKSIYFRQLDELVINNWLFIGLDSCVEGKDLGFLSNIEIQKCESLIRKYDNSKYNIVLVVHHHLLPVGTPLIDDCPIINSTQLLDIINNNRQIKIVITGHVHNDYSIPINELAKLETGLSSFAQFKKGGSNEVEDIVKGYGYKIFEFTKDFYSTSQVFIKN
ncbi:metallophosphoesterase family protein [Silvanigrella aquatica]|uniref:metallophosphoesterase family protein n=1 Tax=Silvanigrella aquatica TaxID=1915309 RepID=UPI000A7A5513|nr:metallophosphoesterase [Silvanigrella aquatica]